MRRLALVILAGFFVACSNDADTSGEGGGGSNDVGGSGGGGSTGPLSLTFIDDFNIDTGTVLDGVEVGGLSGLWIDPADGHAWAICDDQNQFGPVRFYELDVTLDETTLTVTPASHTVFQTGATPASEMDAEGIARTLSGNLFISAEGDSTPIVAPALIRVDEAGALLEELAVDEKHIPNGPPQTRGVGRNQGFEALTISPSGDYLFTATERALTQDGPQPTFTEGNRCRILRYDLTGASSVAEYFYLTEPIPPALPGLLGNAGIGVPEMLALSDTRLLILERSGVEVDGSYTNTIRIFDVSLDGATDIANESAMPLDAVPLDKQLVIDLNSILPSLDPAYPTLDNFEAMSFGPALADGRNTLVLLSDNNFGSTQRTAFFALAME